MNSEIDVTSSLRCRLDEFLRLIALFTIAPALVFAGEDRSFEAQRLQVAEGIGSILVQERVCATVNECRGRQLFFVSPATHGIAIELRTIHGSAVTQRLLAEAARAYVDSGARMRVVVNFYSEDKRTAVKRLHLLPEKPTMSVVYKEYE